MTVDTKIDAVEVKVVEATSSSSAALAAAAARAAKYEKDEEVHVEVTEELDPELEKLLQTEPLSGLTDAEVNERTLKFGKNEIPEKKTNPFLKFLSYFVGSIAFLLEIATIMSAIVQKWPEFGILAFVLILNAIIGFVEEARAESALDALKNTLALRTRAWRNGQLVEVDSATLVPGDVIALRLGDIVPADCRLLGVGVTGEETEGALQIDQSALTGESLPVSKKKGATAYSSSIVKQGQMLAVVTKTGIHTYIGRAANLISITNERGHFQKVIGAIGNFLVIIVLVMVLILMFVLIFARGYEPLDAIVKVLVLTVAAIPVGLPTVMSVTMALGSKQLAKKQVIVKRLTAIEELASVSILCSDKTGTLTLNELTFDNPYLCNRGNTPTDFHATGVPYTNDELLLTAYFASEPGAQDAIELAVRTAAEERVEILSSRTGTGHQIPGYKVNGFIPFNPTSKYTEATVTDHSTGKQFRCIKGAPQVIVRMVGGHDEASEAIIDFARRGLRSLGVARTIDDEMTKFELVGMISLLDPPRPDSAATIKDCESYGVRVKMITGDQLIIAKEVAYRLNMNRTILDAGTLADETLDVDIATERCDKADGFAQVIPEHKYRVVELLQNKGYLVGMTGDGVNDAPALKKANVGIAVAGCTDAARSAADIVLLAHGLSTITDGIKTSRAIFQRMRSYALYRIASTIHFMVFFFLTILIWEYSLSDSLILMITILNDAATLVISVDNARISKRPDKWRLGQLITLSFVLGIVLSIISFAHFFVGVYVLKYDITRALACDHGISETCDGLLNSFIYLNVSSCPHFVIFSTRLPTWLWKNTPHWIFTAVIIGTQIVALVMAATGVFGIGFFGAGPIGWDVSIVVLLVSFAMTFLLDAIKVYVLRFWSFEVTATLWPSPARRRELARRKERVIMLKRYKINVAKLRKVLAMADVIVAFKNAAKKKYITRGASSVEATVVEPSTNAAAEVEPLVQN